MVFLFSLFNISRYPAEDHLTYCIEENRQKSYNLLLTYPGCINICTSHLLFHSVSMGKGSPSWLLVTQWNGVLHEIQGSGITPPLFWISFPTFLQLTTVTMIPFLILLITSIFGSCPSVYPYPCFSHLKTTFYITFSNNCPSSLLALLTFLKSTIKGCLYSLCSCDGWVCFIIMPILNRTGRLSKVKLTFQRLQSIKQFRQNSNQDILI